MTTGLFVRLMAEASRKEEMATGESVQPLIGAH